MKKILILALLLIAPVIKLQGQSYIVSTSVNPPEGGQTSGDGIYDSGATVTVTATPSSGYRFIDWTEGVSSVYTEAGYTFQINSDRNLVANFEQITYTVTADVNPAGSGSISGTGSYDSGASVTATATPAAGYRFVNWTENSVVVSSSASYNFSITANRTLTANFIQLFTVAASPSPAAGGTATGSGTYDSGASVTVTSTPAAGYRFANWTENSIVVSTSASYNFTISANRTLTANFIRTFIVAASPSPAAGGTATGSGTYDSGASVTVTATPAAGYRFANWTENSTVVSSSATYNFAISSNRTLTANFIQTFTVAASPSPAAGGTATGSGTYDSGASVTVTATPASGYRFANWTENSIVVSTSASYNFTISANRTLTANFIQTFIVAASPSPAAGGTATGSGTYDSGASVTVNAIPSSGYRFVNWTEGASVVSANASFSFSISSNRTLTANFIAQYSVATSLNPASGGTTSGGGTFDSGTSVTVTATPAAGYRFANWTENSTVVSSSATYNFAISSNRTLTANFIQTFTVAASPSPAAGGTVTGSGTYDSGASVTVTATPTAGYRFANWTENSIVVSTSASYNFSITANRTLTANFIRTFTVVVSPSPAAGGTATGSGTYDSGASVTVNAIPSSGYRFVNWTEGASVVSANASFSFSISANRTLTANFIAQYSVATSSNPASGGTTSGGGTFDSGTSVTVTATPASGYRFANWTENSIVVSTSASYNFTISANRTLTANFIQTFIVAASPSPAAGGTATGSGTYDSGASVTVTATPAAGYRFANWTENSTVVSSSASYNFAISSNRTLTANFIQTFTVAASPSPAAGGTATGSGTYDSGASVTVTATPVAGYRFANWTENSIVVSTSASYNFSITANRTLTANFIRTFTVVVSPSPAAGGTATGSGTYDSGASVTVNAIPSSGYRFVNWTEGASVVSANASFSFSISANRTLTANFIAQYSVATSSNPASGGTTSGGGTFDSGTSVTVTATPAAGYRFANWTENSTVVSSSATYNFSISSNRTLTANFIQTFTVSTASSPASGGTATGSGTYDSGASVTVTATPAAGYRFANWTENSTVVSSSATYNFAISSNRTLTANFIQTFIVAASPSPAAGGTATGSGTYDSGASVTVTATPVAGYRFANWTENSIVVSTSASYNFSITANRTLTANFIRTFTVVVSPSPAAGGTATGGGTYDSGASVTVTATPAAGYRFANWTENSIVVSTSSSYNFSITANRTLTANFIRTFTVVVSPSPAAGGTATGGGTYDSGASVTVTATPAAGYRFANWTENSTVVSSSATYNFAISSNRTLTANFIRIFTVAASPGPAAGGTATGSGTYDSGASVTVTATPSSGYRFVNWTEGGLVISANASFSFTIGANRTLTANFIRIFTVTTTSNPTVGGTTGGAGTFDSGTPVTLTAVAAAGYRFANWTENGTVVSTTASYNFIISNNRALAANFINIYNVVVSASPASGGTVSGGGIYGAGSMVTLIATATLGYRFVNWTINGSPVSDNSNYSFTVTGNRTLVGNFELIPVVFYLTGPGGELLQNNDTLKTGDPGAGSLSIHIESNFDWTVSENSLWVTAVKESSNFIKVTYAENISVVEKISPVKVRNQLNNEININILQKARVSSLKINKFESIVMFPNPVVDYLYFKPGEESFSKIFVTVTNIQGHKLLSAEFHDTVNEVLMLKVSSLPAGQYYVNISDGTSGKTFRVVKL